MHSPLYFPHPLIADKDGLLAVGGDLSIDRLILAYRFGIFPWYSDDQPLLWWAPRERFIIDVGQMHIPKSMRRYLNNPIFQVTVDQHFDEVIHQCQQIPRRNQTGTWITDHMKQAYQQLHQSGIAHSVEVWHESEIVAGLYGVGVGKIFSGESMFTNLSDASKFAVIMLNHILAKLNFKIIDCQQYSRHMELLGGYSVDHKIYFEEIRQNLFNSLTPEKWSGELIPGPFRK